MNLKPRSSLLDIHSSLVWCNVLVPLFVGMLMVMGWTQSQSHHPSRHGGFRPVLWSAMAHSSPWPPESWPPQKLVPSFSSGSRFCGALGPRHPEPLLWLVIVTASGWSRALRATTFTFFTRSSSGFRWLSRCLDSEVSRKGAWPGMLLEEGE
jgi:hypothetical protein